MKEHIDNMKTEYKNRYGDTITFTEIDDTHIKVTQALDLGNIRTGTDDTGEFIDFQGGPLIHLNEDLGNVHKDLKGKVVKKITFDKGVILEI